MLDAPPAHPGPGAGRIEHDPPDAAVIGRSRDDPEVFALLFQRHAAGLGRYLTRRLGPDLAQDIVADTFLTAFRQRHGYDLGRADALPWLYGIAGNLVRRHYRDEERKLRALARTGLDPVASEAAASAAEQAEARIAADAAGRSVAAALAELNPEQRDVVLLITWAELSYDQAARALGIPEGTVRSRMNRARSRLRAALSGSAPGHDFDDYQENER